MSPLIQIKFGDDSQTSAINRDGGMNPKWTDELIFSRDKIRFDTIVVEVWNYSETGSNDFIGAGYFSLTPALVKDKLVNKTVDLVFENAPAGNINF